MLHLHRGTPYVYQGEELGMTNGPWDRLDQFDDVESRNYVARQLARGDSPDRLLAAMRTHSRDNGRLPMQWDGSPHAGFTTGAPWLPVNPNHVEINAAAQVDDPDSVFACYRRLIELRHTMPVVAWGSFEMLLPDDATVYAFTRSLDDERLLVLANWSGDERRLELPADGWLDAAVLVSNTGRTAGGADDGVIVLAPWEALVLRAALA